MVLNVFFCILRFCLFKYIKYLQIQLSMNPGGSSGSTDVSSLNEVKFLRGTCRRCAPGVHTHPRSPLPLVSMLFV